jgi:predicted TIM-barrel fold metal-dependent hydrolase
MSGVKLDIAIWSYDRAAALRRLMFATDYPYLCVRSAVASAFFHTGDLPETDRTKVSRNWEHLRAEIRR